MANENFTVLTIDDTLDNLIPMKALLVEAFPKALVLTASSGEQGLELAASKNPDLILLDMLMPDMDGFEVCKRMKADQNLSSIPIVFTTALQGERENRIRALEAGADGFLSKPLDEIELTAQVRAMLKIREANLEKNNRSLRAEDALIRINRELRAISSCNQALMRATDEPALLHRICRIVCEEAGYRMAWVGYAMDDEPQSVQPVAWAGHEDGYLSATTISWADNQCGQGPTGTAIRTGITVYCQEFNVDPRMRLWLDSALQRGYRSSICVPLKDENDNTFGALTIYSSVPNAFIPEEIVLLEKLADDLAFGVKSIRTRIERSQAENALRNERSLIQNIMETSPVGIVTVDARGQIQYANTRAESILGLSRSEIGQRAYNAPAWHTMDLSGKPFPSEQEPFNQVMSTAQTIFDIRQAIEWPDGKRISISVNATPMIDTHGQPIGMIASIEDISPRLQAEAALRESEYFFKESQRASHTGSYKLDFKTGRWEFSEVLGQIFGIDRTYSTNIVGWLDLVHLDDREMMNQYFTEQVVAQRKQFNKEYRITRASDRESRWVHGLGELAFDSDGNPVSMIGTIQDITENKVAEAARRLSEDRLLLATHAANIGVWDWDIGNDILVWEDSMYALYGVRKEDFGGAYEACTHTLHPDDRAFTEGEIQAAILGKREYAPEFRIIFPDGTIRTIKAESRTIRDSNGKALRMIGVNVDITERKLAEQELENHRSHLEDLVKDRTSQLELANRELEAFSYSVSHDLRAPLRHIDGFVEMLQDDCRQNLSQNGIRYLETISSAAQRMGILIDDLLRFSHTSRQEIHKQRIDMNTALQEALVQIAEPGSSGKIEWEIAELPWVDGDHNLLRQVWANLVGNAVKYSSTREVPRIQIGFQKLDREIVFTIKDNGVGFDMQYADKLFGVFQRLHRQDEFEGTGIGLVTVLRIISRHGGRVWADAVVDKGATFSFTLPNPG